jgi:hypothetical protein
MFLVKWFFGLVELLSNSFGIEGEEAGDDADDKGDGSDGGEDAGDDADDKGGDADADGGKDGGKDRSKFIPRERFDKVNAKAQKLEKLIELGIIAEDEAGELRVNPEVLKPKGDDKKSTEKKDYRFTKDEVDESSWPLVSKINTGFDAIESNVGFLAGLVFELQGAFKAIDDFPEYLQKDGALRKKVVDIMKNDPEFKATYAKNPKKFYWAVKRAVDFLSNKGPENKPEKPKSKFIIGKGDAGKTGAKKVDLSKLSKEELDKLERQEHDRLEDLRKQGK